MTGLPAHCSHCGHTFVSSAVSINHSTDISFENIQVTCPKCHRMAEGINGTFDFVNAAIRVKRAPTKSVEIISLLQLTLREAKTGTDTTELIARIEKTSPELAQQANKAIQKGGTPVLIAMLFWLLRGCITNPSTKLDWNVLADQARFYISGDDEYRFPEQITELENKPEQPPAQNRQQRRQLERQSKKQQQRPAPRPPKAQK